MNKDQLIHEIGLRLVEDTGAESEDWAQVVLVVEIEGAEPAISGFVYDGAGSHEPFAPNDMETYELALQLRDAMASADKKSPWKAALIRIDRAAGEIDAEFEYKLADRWSINLNNSAQRAVELKPDKY